MISRRVWVPALPSARRTITMLASARRTTATLGPARWTTAVLAAVAVAFLIPAAAEAQVISGAVGDVPTGAPVTPTDVTPQAHISSLPMRELDLPYIGGPVIHSNRTHPIFWQPAGSGLAFDPGYEALIEKFLTDVAADSHKTSNVYGLSGQYTDSTGPAAYDSTYGVAVDDADPLPPNGCSEPPATGPG
ncbi:MAG TPA: hypothetical protein VHZ27_16945, partial [Solirubrobacteraceae bacterium]|nr:hypothetical protein [Solirubrobacteraceae bacterium]